MACRDSYVDPRKPQYIDQATGISYENEPVVRRQQRPFVPPPSPSPSTYNTYMNVLDGQNADTTSPPRAPPGAPSSPYDPRKPQYIDQATGISYENEPVVRRQQRPFVPPPSPSPSTYNKYMKVLDGQNADTTSPPRAPPGPPSSPYDPRKPQYIDKATGISYEHEPVVLRKKRPPVSPESSPDRLPSFGQLRNLFEGPNAVMSPPLQRPLPPPRRPQLPPVFPAAEPAAVPLRRSELWKPNYVDPATGISYEHEPVVRRQKKVAPPVAPPRVSSFPEESQEESVEEVSFHQDERFASERIVSLNESNFDSYVKQKEKALVYFYHQQQKANRQLEDEFSDAADKSVQSKFGYASVNCFHDPWLCNQHKTMQKTPMIKLYSNGYEMSNIDRASEFNADQINMLMKMTPVLTQPRADVGKQLLAEAVEECPMKKRNFLMCK